MKIEISISNLKKVVEWAELNNKYEGAYYVILEETSDKINVKQPNYDSDCCENTMQLDKMQNKNIVKK